MLEHLTQGYLMRGVYGGGVCEGVGVRVWVWMCERGCVRAFDSGISGKGISL